MTRKDKRIQLCLCLLAANLAFIWGNSLLPAEMSQAFSDWVKGLLTGMATEAVEATGGSGLLRKIAHFTEFTTLGVLLAWLYVMRERHWSKALLWGVLAACTDETIQRFVPDRGPSLFDVGIDTCGVITGMLLLHLGYVLWRKNHSTIYGGKQK